MKKTLILAVVVLPVLLMGCTWFSGEQKQKPAAEEQFAQREQSFSEEALVTTEPATPPAPASFADGDLYLQAIYKKDIALCAGLQNDVLKERCTNKLTPTK